MDNVIFGNPTKAFFIDMLTRDIRLDRAIIDLADNCIDGAKNIRSDEKYDGLKVDMTLTEKQFEIKDNCGGFTLNIAQNYAFRFGRPNSPEAKFVKHSIGRFGVGMKRALFKIGRHFLIESKCGSDHFLIEIDVDKWIETEDNWNFTYRAGDDFPIDRRKLVGEDGTIITINRLYDVIKDELVSTEFQTLLKKEISLALSYSLLKGLKVSINDVSISRTDIVFLEKDVLKPLYLKKKIGGVDVKIFAGVGEYSPNQAGWYIFCNDRMVLEADKSYITGWKENREDQGNIIKYHNDYAMFRGAVFFDSEDSSKLPMTTTKTGIDSDHSVFKSTRPIMLTAMKQVINFLRKLDDKEEGESIINNSSRKAITEIREDVSLYSDNFIYPTTKSHIRSNKFVGISYKIERVKVDKVKDLIEVSSNSEVGEYTFNYFWTMNDLD